MIKQNQARQLLDGGSVVGSDGANIGRIGQVYLDNVTGDVSWVTVRTGWFGNHESFVPTDSATVSGATVTVPYDKATIKNAPHSSDAGEALSVDQENDLHAYYGVGTADTATVNRSDTLSPTGTGTAGTVGTDTGTTADAVPADAADGIIRSEERIRVGTTVREAGRARLRKYVVTEDQTVTVPVSHEEVHVVREPIGPGEAPAGLTLGDDSLEVTLHEEQVFIGEEVVGVERVRLGTTTVTEQQRVTGQVRKEQVEVTDVTTPTDTRDTRATSTEADALTDRAVDTARPTR